MQISVTLLQKERRAREENPQPEIPRHNAPVIVAKPVIASAPVTPAVVIKPAAPAFSRAEPIKSMPLEVVPLATPPKAEKRGDFAPRPSFGAYDSMSGEEKKPGSRLMLVGVVAVLIVAAAATFVFLKMQKAGSPAKHVQEAANDVQPAQPSPVVPAGSSQPVTPTVNVPAATTAPGVIVAANSGISQSKRRNRYGDRAVRASDELLVCKL